MTAPNNRERILPRLIDEEIKESFINYSMSVIVSRALPDVRDGLKPVHRRVLYAMNELGLVPGRPYKKSATVVGDVLGKYHPHGDSSVYDALVRMVQTFSLRYPLIDGQGNFGSIDRDPAAAYRYTEARLAPHRDGDARGDRQEHGRFHAEFRRPAAGADGAAERHPEPGGERQSGIAVGMATNIPPHNMREVIAAVAQLIEKPDATAGEIRKFIKGPDFPTGAYIYGREGIRSYQETGRGKIIMRARAVIEENERGSKSQIVITEIPYQVTQGASARRRSRELHAREEARGHRRSARRIGPRRHAHRDRAQARCDPARGAQPAVQAHDDAEHVRRDHARARARPEHAPARAEGDAAARKCSSTSSRTATR